jgi:thiol:disulfide interchange protein/DsbC/DsbD-like thiol-disulfide interchange protein
VQHAALTAALAPSSRFPHRRMPLPALILWPALALALAVPCAARSQPSEARTEQVAVRLLAAADGVQPGQSLLVGVQQKIIPQWHTYWANPGDSGLATTIAWTLPPGATASPIHWPVPARYTLGPITNYGYADEVTLPSVIQLPATLREGERVALKAKVDWLVCHDVCIPQSAELALSLPVTAAATPGADAAVLQAAQARLPQKAGAMSWRLDGGRLQLDLPATLPAHDAAYFFARQWGRVAHAEPQQLQGTRLSMAPGDTPPQAGEAVDGVLVLQRGGQTVQALAIGHDPMPLTPVASTVATTTPTTTAPAASTAPTLWLALAFALLGGLVLNLMPCVFPVLTIKVLSLMQTAQGSRREVRLHGLAYLAGVLASFAVLAGLLVALKAGGGTVGWGFQFQSPVFVLLLALLMFAVGLSLSGVVTIGSGAAGLGSGLAAKPGLRGSFFTGVLATVVATPCTAPFMGVAIGFALAQPAGVTFAVFLALGFGLALPYLLLCEWPALQRRLPRPGPWMERLKQALAFPMYASAAWLAWVLARQSGPESLAVLFAGVIAIALAAWLYGSTRHVSAPRARHASAAVAALLVLVAVGGGSLGVGGPVASSPERSAASPEAGWEPYTPERLAALRGEGKPVFVNLTADWCITCLVNERVALSTAPVDAAFREAGITRLKGDWTRGDERITRLLAEHGRSGVPLYLFFPAGAGSVPQVLPQLLTPDLVLAALKAPAP